MAAKKFSPSPCSRKRGGNLTPSGRIFGAQEREVEAVPIAPVNVRCRGERCAAILMNYMGLGEAYRPSGASIE